MSGLIFHVLIWNQHFRYHQSAAANQSDFRWALFSRLDMRAAAMLRGCESAQEETSSRVGAAEEGRKKEKKEGGRKGD